MNEITGKRLTGERALFRSEHMKISDTIFDDGESPLKESRDISLSRCMFKWKYPLWYGQDITVENCTLFEMGRAGIWYTDRITVKDTLIEAPKSFRKCSGINLKNVNFTRADETLWNCRDISIDKVTAKGDYFAMNCEDLNIRKLELVGNYPFDGAKNVTVESSRLISKDAFWNCENVTVKNSFISGEYLGWNSKDLVFENCVIESLQGLCYVDGLTMKNCTLLNTTLAFEYSTVDAQINGTIDSVKNPFGGRIVCDGINELIMEPDMVDVNETVIIYRSGTDV
ncbi:MAG: DUF3737 family protein [Ruminococcus sp.]|nr:DUF3737 family protein [Ruminococcus sp.]